MICARVTLLITWFVFPELSPCIFLDLCLTRQLCEWSCLVSLFFHPSQVRNIFLCVIVSYLILSLVPYLDITQTLSTLSLPSVECRETGHTTLYTSNHKIHHSYILSWAQRVQKQHELFIALTRPLFTEIKFLSY